MTITDDSGLVVGRGHSDKLGDYIDKSRDSIWLPLKGKPVTGVEPGNIVKLTMGAGVPIIYNDKIIGAMTLGTDMTSGVFVNHIKEQLGVECTIFENDVRVSTTVMNSENKPAVGTKLNNKTIYDEVMNQGKPVFSRNIILNNEYSTVYWPFKDFSGDNSGMLFIGLPRKAIEAEQNDTMLYMIIAGVVLGLIMTTIGFFVSRAIILPLKITTRYAEEVSQGHFDGTLNVSAKDEVGTLARALQNMVRTIKIKISEADSEKKEAETQAEAARLATEKAEE